MLARARLSSGWGVERPNKKNPEGPSPWCLCQQLALVLRRPAPEQAFARLRISVSADFACLQPTGTNLAVYSDASHAASCDPSLRFRACRQLNSQDYASGSYLAFDRPFHPLNQPSAKDPHHALATSAVSTYSAVAGHVSFRFIQPAA